ncbi:transmembrane protein [Mycobacteroides abscessus subsp. abscessus]|nr:transmembrane protein [Mycobacteroides abscessus subsp. abscessus]SKV30621.1 transmembrane protein [Mycobacteroides abscessus subsp. abscessus]
MAAGRRTATIVLTSSHAALSLIAGLLFFFFVLPRWPELNGATGHTFGTGMRIVGGLLVAAAGAPVLISWRRTRRPEFATPRLALTLRAASFTGHFLAGVLIVGTAIAEIWLDLDVLHG